MRIYMQEPPGSDGAPRYVQLLLQQDLLGGWTLYQETGREGSHARLSKRQFLDAAEAAEAFEHARDLQLRKGFKVMIVEGATGAEHAH